MSYIVFTSLVVGKILGFVIGSTIATSLGLQPPRGVTPADVKMCGLIASTGLTVAIFMCGQAFPHYPRMQAHAKIGALLSIFSSFFAVLISPHCNLSRATIEPASIAGDLDPWQRAAKVDPNEPPRDLMSQKTYYAKCNGKRVKITVDGAGIYVTERNRSQKQVVVASTTKIVRLGHPKHRPRKKWVAFTVIDTDASDGTDQTKYTFNTTQALQLAETLKLAIVAATAWKRVHSKPKAMKTLKPGLRQLGLEPEPEPEPIDPKDEDRVREWLSSLGKAEHASGVVLTLMRAECEPETWIKELEHFHAEGILDQFLGACPGQQLESDVL